MSSAPVLLWHGGVPGLRRNDIIEPGMAEHRYVAGCPHCEAQDRGETSDYGDAPTPEGWVYATVTRIYGRYYASRAHCGDLYRVQLLGEVERSTEDHFPTWRAPSARIDRVVERNVTLTMKQRRHLFKKWGGTDEEFDDMIHSVLARTEGEG